MIKRMLVGLGWFLSVGWGLNLLATFTDFPSSAGMVIAFGAGAFFAADPLGVTWSRSVDPASHVSRDRIDPYGRSPESFVHPTI